MTGFDHREPGTSPDDWTAHFLAYPPAEWDSWREASGIVVLAPHPDDETLAVGGLIAEAGEAGIPVHVLLVTRGEHSHPNSPTYTPAQLAELREREFRTAMTLLNPHAALSVLGITDGELATAQDVVSAAVADACDAAGSAALLLAPWHSDGHTDHDAAGTIAVSIAEERGVTTAEYPIWLWHWGSPETAEHVITDLVCVPLSATAQARKRLAMDAYPSQTLPLSPAPGDEAIVDREHLKHYDRAVEFLITPRQPRTTSRSQDSFADHYRRHPQGWNFSDSWYEQRKRDTVLAALPSPRYRSVLEVGCATGVLTALLAERSDTTLGIDIVEAPLIQARKNAPTAEFARMTVPAEWPEGRFDLIVLSEVAYYLSGTDLDALLSLIDESLTEDGALAACHWRHPDGDAVTDARSVHARIAERWSGRRAVHHVEDDFLLDVFVRAQSPSVAAEEGLS